MSRCELCGEPMPAGEEMFKYHGYSGSCPKPPLLRPRTESEPLPVVLAGVLAELRDKVDALQTTYHDGYDLNVNQYKSFVLAEIDKMIGKQ